MSSSLLAADRSLLLVVDLQGKLAEAVEDAAVVLATAERLLRFAELFEVPVLLSEQYPKGLGPTHPRLLARFESLAVTKARLVKNAFGCGGDPQFLPLLAQLRPEIPLSQLQVVITGIETHVCVMATVLELRAQGADVHVCFDATSGRGAARRAWAFERMAAAGATITNHESVGFEWARTKDHPRFRELSAILKTGEPS